jgi:hypothetical protein
MGAESYGSGKLWKRKAAPKIPCLSYFHRKSASHTHTEQIAEPNNFMHFKHGVAGGGGGGG